MPGYPNGQARTHEREQVGETMADDAKTLDFSPLSEFSAATRLNLWCSTGTIKNRLIGHVLVSPQN